MTLSGTASTIVQRDPPAGAADRVHRRDLVQDDDDHAAASSSASATSRCASSAVYDKHVYMTNDGRLVFGVYNGGTSHG